MSLFVKINEVKNQLTNSERKIANYVLSYPEKVYNLSTYDLAKYSETSPSSVVRFCQRMGFNGFQEFKVELIKNTADLENNKNIVYEDVTIDDTIEEVMDKIALENITSIEKTKKLLDGKEMERAIKALEEAENIYIFGMGASGIVAMDFQYKLMRINRNAIFYLDGHTQMASAVHISKDDIAVGISYSGRTLEVLKSMSKAKEEGADTISITKFGENPISNISDIRLFVGNIEKNLRLGAISSRIAQLTVIDMLFVGIAREDFNLVSEHLKKTRMIVDDFKV